MGSGHELLEDSQLAASNRYTLAKLKRRVQACSSISAQSSRPGFDLGAMAGIQFPANEKGDRPRFLSFGPGVLPRQFQIVAWNGR